MSTEQTETAETVDSDQAENTNDNQEQAGEKPSKPAGYDPVDLSDLPPEKQKELDNRIRYLYTQVKQNERSVKEFRSIAEQQSKYIDDLMNGVGQVVDHLHTRSIGETEDEIRKSMRAAFEAGDTDKYLSEQERLLEVKAQKLAQKQPKQKTDKKESVRAQVGVQSAEQLAYEAQQDGEITPEQVMVVATWQDEKDSSGQPLRPWARTADMSDPDPDFVKAQLVAKRVFTMHPDRSVEENLAEVDRQMGVKKVNGRQTVMGGSLTTPAKQNRITLSPELQKLAVRTKFGGSKAKTDAEHIEAYRKQMERVRSHTSQRSR